MKEQILSIKEINRYIKMKLESDAVLQNVWIRGEISNFTRHTSGHMYFTLKDPDSRIKCIMFASHNQRLGFIPKEGAKVVARGSISIYERDGQYQFYVTHMQPDGIGNLYQAFEQLKKQLEEEGLFQPGAKKPLPRFPRAVGVVTSPTGAAVRDIIITIRRRFPSVPILLYPALVQGAGAAPSIVRGIEAMNALGEVDVLIVGRGGGSMEELWAFNEEVVARAIYASVIPIISAVGHETDFTIADFVADVRAATPTAAAELAVPHVLELKQQLQSLQLRVRNGWTRQLKEKQERLRRAQRSTVFTQPRRHFLAPAERVDRLTQQLQHLLQARVSRLRERVLRLDRSLSAVNPKQQAAMSRQQLQAVRHRLLQSMGTARKDKAQQFQVLLRQLDALSPLKVMQRGYSLVYEEKKKKLITSIGQVQLGDIVKVRLTDGQLDCQVWSMQGEDEENGRTAAAKL